LKQTKKNGKNIEIFPFYMNFGEFRKHTPYTHLYLAKPHGYWTEASGVYMPTPNFNPTWTPEVLPKSWTAKRKSALLLW